MNNQLTELLTKYGKVDAIWFDGMWDQKENPNFDWQLPGQYALIHRLQPGCLIGNNHHSTPNPGRVKTPAECQDRTSASCLWKAA